MEDPKELLDDVVSLCAKVWHERETMGSRLGCRPHHAAGSHQRGPPHGCVGSRVYGFPKPREAR